jgi:hypothetical protein
LQRPAPQPDVDLVAHEHHPGRRPGVLQGGGKRERVVDERTRADHDQHLGGIRGDHPGRGGEVADGAHVPADDAAYRCDLHGGVAEDRHALPPPG